MNKSNIFTKELNRFTEDLDKKDLIMETVNTYNNLKKKYGEILGMSMYTLHSRTIVTTFPVKGIKYKHASKTKQADEYFDPELYIKFPTEFEQYVEERFKNRNEIDKSCTVSYTNLGFMRREFKRVLWDEGIYVGDFNVIKRDDLRVYAGDYLIWVRVLDENGEVVKKFDGKIRDNWTLDYMVSEVAETKQYRKRYELKIGIGETKTVCELCGEIKDNDDLTLDYRRIKYHTYLTSREENYCGCYGEYEDRYTCIEENLLENLFRKLLASKGFLVKISDIHCDFEISDDQFCNKKDGSIKLCVSRDDEKFDDYFIEAGFEVDCTGLEPEYNFYKRYDNFKSFADDIDFLNEHLSKLPKNSIFLFDGYKKEVKDWKAICIEEVNMSKDN